MKDTVKTFEQNRAEYHHAQALYWIAQAQQSLRNGYQTTAHSCIVHASQNICELIKYKPDPELESAEQAQAHELAVKTATEYAEKERKDGTDDINPEQIETIADLRARIKAGDPTARELANDLVSDCPTQCTGWIMREDLERYAQDDYTPEQVQELWEMLQTADIVDTDGEIRNICEIYETEQGAE